jgi:methyl-accepting chemotaxis protein
MTMNWFRNLPTRTKLYLGFGTVLALLVAVIGVAYSGLTRIRNAEHFAHELMEVRNETNFQRAMVLEQIASPEKAVAASLQTEMHDRDRTVNSRLDSLAEYARDQPVTSRQLEAMKVVLMSFRMTRDSQIALLQQGKSEEAGALIASSRDARNQLREIALDLDAQAQEHAAGVADRAMASFIVMGGLALVTAITTITILNRMISGRLSEFMRFVEGIGRGDLTKKAVVQTDSAASRNELDKLGHVLNQTVSELRDLAGQTVSVSANLNSAAAEIMAAAQQQAASTREQAASVQEITSTMQEIGQSGGEIADKAKQVAGVAEAASTASASGLQSVLQTNQTMESIREQVEEVAENIVALSEKMQAVGEIILTVGDIAEQSNLLALNASIEAVSAGEQGGRFGVVAGEMKNLADQAKQCTVQVRMILGDVQKGINTSVMLTEEAVKRVESGKQQADRTEQTIRQMTGTTQQSIQAFQQIVGATNQQQIGFDQVTQGMQDIRQAAEQTAIGTSQLERAVANVNALGQQLRTAVGRYQI